MEERQLICVGWPAFSGDVPFPHVIEAGSPHARYALVKQTGEQWDVTVRAVPYAWERAAGIAMANGRPDIAYCLMYGHMASRQACHDRKAPVKIVR